MLVKWESKIFADILAFFGEALSGPAAFLECIFLKILFICSNVASSISNYFFSQGKYHFHHEATAIFSNQLSVIILFGNAKVGFR